MKTIPKPRPGGILRFGKRKAKRDGRNRMFATLLKAPPVLPAECDFEVAHHGIPTPLFGNGGDCVMAGRARQTRHFEKAQQNKLIAITDIGVLHDRFSRIGDASSGRVVSDARKDWRSGAWLAAKRLHEIKACAEIDCGKRMEVKHALFRDIGLGLDLTKKRRMDAATPEALLAALRSKKPAAATKKPVVRKRPVSERA